LTVAGKWEYEYSHPQSGPPIDNVVTEAGDELHDNASGCGDYTESTHQGRNTIPQEGVIVESTVAESLYDGQEDSDLSSFIIKSYF
jgi:hypothetical protein